MRAGSPFRFFNLLSASRSPQVDQHGQRAGPPAFPGRGAYPGGLQGAAPFRPNLTREMMTAAEAIALLAKLPADTPLCLCADADAGTCIEVSQIELVPVTSERRLLRCDV